MNPILLLTIIQSLLASVPELLTLYDRLKSGTPVTNDEVQAILSKYSIDHAQLNADIAAARAAGN